MLLRHTTTTTTTQKPEHSYIIHCLDIHPQSSTQSEHTTPTTHSSTYCYTIPHHTTTTTTIQFSTTPYTSASPHHHKTVITSYNTASSHNHTHNTYRSSTTDRAKRENLQMFTYIMEPLPSSTTAALLGSPAPYSTTASLATKPS